MHRLAASSLTACCLFMSSTAWADWPPGAEIDPALMIDVTEDGFASLSEVLPTLVPSELPIDDISQSDSYDLWLATFEWSLDVTNLDLGITVDYANIRPGNGVLFVDLDVFIWLNEAANPANINVDTNWFGTLADCDTFIDPFPVTISTTIGLDVLDSADGRYLDATIGDIDWEIGLSSSDLSLDCWLGDINEVFEWIGIDLVGLILDLAEGPVDGIIQDFGSELEATVEEAFSGISINEEIDLLGSTLYLQLEPSAVEIVPEAMRISMASAAFTDPHPCIAGNGINASLETALGLPTIGAASSGIARHDVGVFADDDFVNQILFAAYYGGVLCYELSGEQGDLPINTALLGTLAPGVFDELFPEPQNVIIQTRPASPPVASAEGEHDVGIVVEKLGVDFYANLDHRDALILGMDIDVDAGLDLNFDGDTGKLDLEVALSEESILAATRHNEFAPGQDDAVADQFTGLFNSLVQPILGSALEGLSFDVPSIEGIGLTSLEAAPSGPGRDWFGFYGGVGEVPYESAGCGEGCGGDGGGEGCGGGGCSASAATGQGFLILVPLLGVLTRRRR